MVVRRYGVSRSWLLPVCALVFFFPFLLDPPRQATPARTNATPTKTPPGNSAVSIPAAPVSNARSSTHSFSTNSDQNILKDFQQWVEVYGTADPPQKIKLLPDGLSLAAERREIIAGLIESNPAEALRQAVPMRLRGQLPPEITALLEERVSGRGEFNVIAALPVSGAEKTVRPIDRFARLAGQT